MTRLFWTLIALFPLPLVLLLLAGPPELFERERVQAAHDIAAELAVSDIDWRRKFAISKQVVLTEVVPDAAAKYTRLGLTLQSDAAREPVLVAHVSANGGLRYRILEECWMLPADQFTMLRRCLP